MEAESGKDVLAVRRSGRGKWLWAAGLFLALVLVSVGGFFWKQWPTARLVAKLEPNMGTVVVLHSWLPWGEEKEHQSPTTPWERMTGRLVGVKAQIAVDGETVRSIVRHRKLERLELYATAEGVVEDDFSGLGEMHGLRVLRLPGTVAVGDATLRRLGGLEGLSELRVWEASGVTGEGVRALRGLDGLKSLRLVRLKKENLAGIERAVREEGIEGLCFVEFRFLELHLDGEVVFADPMSGKEPPARNEKVLHGLVSRADFVRTLSGGDERGTVDTPYGWEIGVDPGDMGSVEREDAMVELTMDMARGATR